MKKCTDKDFEGYNSTNWKIAKLNGTTDSFLCFDSSNLTFTAQKVTGNVGIVINKCKE